MPLAPLSLLLSAVGTPWSETERKTEQASNTSYHGTVETSARNNGTLTFTTRRLIGADITT